LVFLTPLEIQANTMFGKWRWVTFPTAMVGYAAPAQQTVTVANTGGQPTGATAVTKAGANPDAFTVSPSCLASLPPGGRSQFTVVPVTGLPPGTYTIRVNVTGANG